MLILSVAMEILFHHVLRSEEGDNHLRFDLSHNINVALEQDKQESNVTVTFFWTYSFHRATVQTCIKGNMMDHQPLYCTLIFVPPANAPHTYTHTYTQIVLDPETLGLLCLLLVHLPSPTNWVGQYQR